MFKLFDENGNLVKSYTRKFYAGTAAEKINGFVTDEDDVIIPGLDFRRPVEAEVKEDKTLLEKVESGEAVMPKPVNGRALPYIINENNEVIGTVEQATEEKKAKEEAEAATKDCEKEDGCDCTCTGCTCHECESEDEAVEAVPVTDTKKEGFFKRLWNKITGK